MIAWYELLTDGGKVGVMDFIKAVDDVDMGGDTDSRGDDDVMTSFRL